MKNKKSQKLWFNGIIAFGILFVCAAVIFRIFDIDVLPSQLYGALLGTVITAIITVFLLNGQSENEMKREKDSKVFENKIQVYSEFTDKLWGMLDDEVISLEEITELRKLCFKNLVFYLNNEQAEELQKCISKIANPTDKDKEDSDIEAIAAITRILQENLFDGDKLIETGRFRSLYNSFKKQPSEASEILNSDIELKDTTSSMSIQTSKPTFWHFNMLDVQKQIDAIKSGNYFLALIEYGENWRSNSVLQVKPNDVVFLFQRGGPGYVGVFRVIEPRVHVVENISKDESSREREQLKKDDLYGGHSDGATHISGLQVAPIAFNYKGVGYPSVRRRTIERMNEESAKWLINKFKGNDLPKGHEAGIGYIDAETKIECPHANIIG